jgi:hypothetical protein
MVWSGYAFFASYLTHPPLYLPPVAYAKRKDVHGYQSRSRYEPQSQSQRRGS